MYEEELNALRPEKQLCFVLFSLHKKLNTHLNKKYTKLYELFQLIQLLCNSQTFHCMTYLV